MLEFVKVILLGPVNDMKTTPGTSLSVIFVWCVIAYAAFVTLPKLAMAAEVRAQEASIEEFKRTAQSVQNSVAALNQRLMYDGMRRNLDQLDGELYTVNREIQRQRVGGGDAADYLLDRQRQLANRRAELQEKIAALLRQNPDLVYQ